MSGRASSSQVTFALLQVIVTGLLAGSPLPLSVKFVPARPVSGAVLRMPMFGAAVAGAAIGPGSPATPGIAGAVTGPPAARPAAGASSIAAAATAPTATLRSRRAE